MSQGTTLPPGTVIITGTLSGIGNSRSPKVWLKHGDEVRCWISHGMGSLINGIKYETEDDVSMGKVRMKKDEAEWRQRQEASSARRRDDAALDDGHE